MLQTFDAPNGDFACVRRARSNTPLQALATLNEPEFLECARALALQTLARGRDHRDGSSDLRLSPLRGAQDRRRPSRGVLNGLLQNGVEAASGPGASTLGSAGSSGRTSEIARGRDPAQLAAWTAVSRVLLNLDETITKE